MQSPMWGSKSRTGRSGPEPKSDAQPTEPPRCSLNTPDWSSHRRARAKIQTAHPTHTQSRQLARLKQAPQRPHILPSSSPRQGSTHSPGWRRTCLGEPETSSPGFQDHPGHLPSCDVGRLTSLWPSLLAVEGFNSTRHVRASDDPAKIAYTRVPPLPFFLCFRHPAKNSRPVGGRNHPLRERGLCEIKRVLLFTETQPLSAREQPTGSCSESWIFPFGGTEVYLEREEPVLKCPRFTCLAASRILFPSDCWPLSPNAD